MIGSEFLRFIELSGQIKCSQSLRFMDDIYLFDDDMGTLTQDFLRIQELLGIRALNVNATKTIIDGEKVSVLEAASAIQEELAKLIQDLDEPDLFLASGAGQSELEDDESENSVPTLNEEQIDRLLELLVEPKAEETDVELILGILQKHSDKLSDLIPSLLAKFPNIVKQLHKLVGQIAAKDNFTNQLISLLDTGTPLIEYQLFWITVIAEDHLSKTANFGKLIMRLYERTATQKIARAKILEIPDQTFGLKEIRDELLKTGASDWPSWAAAVGTRTLNKAERNYALKYFSKGSPLNSLIAECVQKL